MQYLTWDDATRRQHRQAWYRAEVNAADWFADYLPQVKQDELSQHADQETLQAFDYLNNRLDIMTYTDFAEQGFPIGSGQVEAMNKAVIGHRLKRSGMHWSPSGARNMAALRAQTHAKYSLISFQNLRHKAFPPPV
ncbi:MAG: hypothetical protein AAF708_12360 [Deinococcota bacterium]